jgi:hypothetical protein
MAKTVRSWLTKSTQHLNNPNENAYKKLQFLHNIMKLFNTFIYLTLFLAASLVKADTLRASANDDRKLSSSGYYEYKGYACRDDDGKKGRAGPKYKYDYTLYRGWNKSNCKRACDNDDYCAGYEYFYGDKKNQRHCELWWVDYGNFEEKYGFDCYWKKDFDY